MKGYRKELKFIVGDDILTDVRNRISPLMRYDEHQNGDHYRIRSVYFDSPSLTCYRENMAGVSFREKYRIRTYECSDRAISAEIKIRHRDTISKMSSPIDRDLFEKLVVKGRQAGIQALMQLTDRTIGHGDEYQADAGKYDDRRVRVFEKYLARIAGEAYQPVCIVEYERSAYVYDIGNVRITFDRNVTVSTDYSHMFDRTMDGCAVLPGNLHILEIKYDEFLPDEIKTVLGGLGLVRCSSSKYAMSCDMAAKSCGPVWSA